MRLLSSFFAGRGSPEGPPILGFWGVPQKGPDALLASDGQAADQVPGVAPAVAEDPPRVTDRRPGGDRCRGAEAPAHGA